MPKIAPKTAPKTERKIAHPELDCKICDAENPLTATQAMALLDWENEKAYAERVKAENPKAKNAQLEYGKNYLLKDLDGIKVRCWNNNLYNEKGKLEGATNRPFDEGWAWSMAQIILNKQFAPDGPNGEAIVISRTGMILSGQHRLIGLVLAWMVWNGWGRIGRAQKAHWREIWGDEEPSIQTFVNFGVSEEPRSVMTLDNVKPRSPADMFYTSEHFAKLDVVGRRECSRMLGAAAALFWQRTGAKTDFDKAMTNQALMSLVDRHPGILKAVKVIYDLNVERVLSKPEYKLSPGQSAAMLYLMGTSATDGERDGRTGQIQAYLTADPGPNEKKLDKNLWDKACSYWQSFASGDPKLKEVRYALKALNENAERGASSREKMAVIAQGWKGWLARKSGPTEADCKLEYVTDEHGQVKLKETPSVGGIDLGDPKEAAGTPDEPNGHTKEDQEAEKRRIREEQARRLIEDRASKNGGKAKSRATGAKDSSADKLRAELRSVKEDHPDTILLFASKSGGHSVYEEDATAVASVLGLTLKEPAPGSLLAHRIAARDFEQTVVKLHEATYAVAVAKPAGEGRFDVKKLAAEEPGDEPVDDGEEIDVEPAGDEEE